MLWNSNLILRLKLLYILSRAPASGPGKEGKVEGSQLRLYKAKEGSRKHEALHA
jgi:hypothetical protein